MTAPSSTTASCNCPRRVPDLGFSGFRMFGDAQAGRQREVAIFQGASFFRSSARGQNLGVMARGLTLKAGDPKGEEFPLFRAFWIEQPAVRRRRARHPRAARFRERRPAPTASRCGPASHHHRHRGDAVPARARSRMSASAGMTSTYLFGPNDRRGVDDVRPAVYEAAGLQIHNGNGEWIWRPLANPETLQISAFVDPAPKGFGLIQRDRDCRRLPGRRPALRAPAQPVDRADRRLGAGLGATRRDPDRIRDQRQHRGLLAAQAAAAAGRRGLLRLSAVLVLAAAGAADLAIVTATRVGQRPDGDGAALRRSTSPATC